MAVIRSQSNGTATLSVLLEFLPFVLAQAIAMSLMVTCRKVSMIKICSE